MNRARLARRARLACAVALLAFAPAPPAGAEATAADCNAYFPLRADARWVYEEGQKGSPAKMQRTITVRSVSTSDGVTSAELAQEVTLPGQPGVVAGQAMTRAHCDASGVTLWIDGSAGVDGQTSAVIKAKLPGLPPADDLKPGFSWRGDSEVETMDAGTLVVAQGTRGSRVEGVESVTVPAGTFPEALRVASVQTLTLRRGGDERYAKQQTLEWYVRGIGLVKRETRTSAGSEAAASIEELRSYSGLQR
ncbi:MAG: hypothetical protein AB1689_22925 [Thermodesulfobacteriota bacterium]